MKKAMLSFAKQRLSNTQMKLVIGGNEPCCTITCSESIWIVGTADVSSCDLESSIYEGVCKTNWPNSEYDSCSCH